MLLHSTLVPIYYCAVTQRSALERPAWSDIIYNYIYIYIHIYTLNMHIGVIFHL